MRLTCIRCATRLPSWDWSCGKKPASRLEFAHHCTVTARNVEFVPEIVRWALEKPERTYLWRLFSFQPEADTGRTYFSEMPATPAVTWQKLCEGTGLPLEREFSIFGHPDCNSWTPLLVSRRTGRFIVFPPQDARTKKLYEELLASVGGVSFVSDDARTTPFRLLGILFQNPLLIVRLLAHISWLLINGKIPAEFIGALATSKAHTVGFGIHNFMDAAQVADAPEEPHDPSAVGLLRVQRRGQKPPERGVGSGTYVRHEPAALERRL